MAVARRTGTVVIGAGHAGLAMSHELTRVGRGHVVLDRGRIAQRWRTQSWDSLHLLTPNWMSRLPGWCYTGPDPDGYMPATELVTYLRDYASSFDAPVREHTTVLDVSPAPGGYRVVSADGTWFASSVVVATGAAAVARRPPESTALDPDLTQLDAADYRKPAGLPDGGVLVVGASASGLQIADELARAGRDVVLAVGSHTRLPRTYRGHDILWWLEQTGSLDRTIDDARDPGRARREPSPQLVGRPGLDLDLGVVAGRGVTVTGRLAGAQGQQVCFADDLWSTTSAADARMRRVLAAVDGHARAGSVATPDLSPPPVLLSDGPRAMDLRARGVTTVVWATGHRRSYPWLRVPVTDGEGDLVHRRGVTPAAGLYVLGMRFQHRRRSSFLDGARHDARYLVQHITGSATARADAA